MSQGSPTERRSPVDDDGWCLDCGDEFHLDDCGGYNPPCPCGCGRCRDCCEERRREERGHDDWYPEDDDDPLAGVEPGEPHGEEKP